MERCPSGLRCGSRKSVWTTSTVGSNPTLSVFIYKHKTQERGENPHKAKPCKRVRILWGCLRAKRANYIFSGQLIIRLKWLFSPQSAVCIEFGGWKFPINSHFISPESPFGGPISLNYSHLCPISVYQEHFSNITCFRHYFSFEVSIRVLH